MNRLFQKMKCIITVSIILFALSVPLLAQESESDGWNKAQVEMKAMFGSVPVMFAKLPMHVRASTWEWFKSISNPDAAIPPKYGELMGLAVASQIPCEYCVYAHTSMARMLGATDEEIQEAVMKSAEVRHWSTILNGNQVSFESFKSNWDDILAFVKANSESK